MKLNLKILAALCVTVLAAASCVKAEKNVEKLPVPEAVDLGLSVKWASFNLGASKPEEYGDYYAWGETEPYYLPGHAYDDPCSDWRGGKSAGVLQ